MRRSLGSGQRYSPTWLSNSTLAVGAVLILTLLGWEPTLSAIGSYLIVDDGLRVADAVVVLSGDYGHKRLEAGLAAVRQGTADRIIVLMDLPTDSNQTAIVRRDVGRAGIDARRLIVTGDVHSTAEDAARAADIMRRYGWRTAVAVTSPYHTRRAAWAFRRVWAPLGLSASFHPSGEAAFHRQRWWRDNGSLQTVLLEYAKFAAYVVWFTFRQ